MEEDGGNTKIIHYCWFGEGKIPNQYQKYIKTMGKNISRVSYLQMGREKFSNGKIQICDGGSKIGENGFCVVMLARNVCIV